MRTCSIVFLVLAFTQANCGGECSDDSECVSPKVCRGYDGIFFDTRVCVLPKEMAICGPEQLPCPSNMYCHPTYHVCWYYDDEVDEDSEVDGEVEVDDPEPDTIEVEADEEVEDPDIELDPDVELDPDTDPDPDPDTEPDEDEEVAICEDNDDDGYLGTGDACDQQDPDFDCNDGNGSIHPSAEEICDTIDNDCDRLVDNVDDDLVTSLCPLTEGVCTGLHSRCDEGNLVGCADADYQLHSGNLYVQIEDGVVDWCDNHDNDCDGTVDENISRNCYTGEPGTLDVGICQGGTETCAEGQWGSCEGEVTPDTEGNNINCDGLDNDCDQTVDEECECVYDAQDPPTQPCYTGPDFTRNIGICHDGEMLCQPNDRWGQCQGDQTPGQETCGNPGVDDDCDDVEDNVPFLESPCTDHSEDGICQNGEYQCQGDSLLCISTTTPQDETCGNIGTDDDCDGELDNVPMLNDVCLDLTQDGICQNGEYRCRGVDLVCVSTTSPQDETCGNMGTDDDCDGIPDDGDICVLPQASSDCVGETCSVLECDTNASNDDEIDENGCEVWCDTEILVHSLAVGEYGEVWGGRAVAPAGAYIGVAYTALGEPRDIYFARLDSEGLVGNEVRITNTDSHSPSLVFTGSEYGMVWQDRRDGNYEIYFTRLSTSGNKIGEDVRITNDSSGSTSPSLVFTGSEYGVAWCDYRDDNTEIYFARISTSGNKIGEDVRITNDSTFSMRPSLVFTGSEYGVAWHSSTEIYFTRLSTSGNNIGGDLRITNDNSGSTRPSLVFTGSEYGVVWSDNRDGNDEIYFARISTSGNKIGEDVRITNDSSNSTNPSLVFMGSEYGMSWHDHDTTTTAFLRFEAQSGVVKGGVIHIGGASCGYGYSSLAISDKGYTIIWENSPAGCQVDYTIFECGDESQ